MVDDYAEEEDKEASMPRCCKIDDLEDLDEDDDSDKSKGRKR